MIEQVESLLAEDRIRKGIITRRRCKTPEESADVEEDSLSSAENVID